MSKDEYLITDAPLKALTVFAMPMILGSFFQQIYNMADSIIVGQFVGSSALAAVGACAALTNVFICVALGAGVGAGVLVSRYFGARDYGKMKTIVSTSLISFLVLSILLGIFGFCFSHLMMSLLQTPPDILDEAVLYLRVYFVGFPFLFMYNILSTMFTSIGESRIPLVLLIFSSVLNIFLDILFIVPFHASNCHTVSSPAVYSVDRYDDRTGSCKSIWYTGTRRLLSNDASGKCFFTDFCIHRQCDFAVYIPESWCKENRTAQKRLSCGTGVGSMFRSPCFSGH